MVQRNLRGSDAERFLKAAVIFRDARLRFSQEFLLNKARGTNITDRTAEHMAISATNDELTVLAAELDVAKREFYAAQSAKESNDSGESGS